MHGGIDGIVFSLEVCFHVGVISSLCSIQTKKICDHFILERRGKLINILNQQPLEQVMFYFVYRHFREDAAGCRMRLMFDKYEVKIEGYLMKCD